MTASSRVNTEKERSSKRPTDPYFEFKDNEKLAGVVSFLKPIYKKYGRSVVLNILGWYDVKGRGFVSRTGARKFFATTYSYKPFKGKVGV